MTLHLVPARPDHREEQANLRLLIRTLESRAAQSGRVVISSRMARMVGFYLRRLLEH